MKKKYFVFCGLGLSALVLAFVARASRPCSEPRAGRPRDGSAAPAALERLLEQGETAERSEDIPGAGANYRKATEQFPDHASAWVHYGEYLRFFTADKAGARDAFDRALAAPVSDKKSAAFAWRGLGELAEKRGDTAEAIELLQKSLAALPLSDTHRSLCHLYGFRGKNTEAAQHALLAAKLSPEDPIAALLAAAQLERAGKHDEGKAMFENGMALGGCQTDGSHAQPVHCCVLMNASGYFAVAGQPENALKFLKAFLETPNHRHLSREHIVDDPDFAALRDDPEFLKIVDAYLPK